MNRQRHRATPSCTEKEATRLTQSLIAEKVGRRFGTMLSETYGEDTVRRLLHPEHIGETMQLMIHNAILQNMRKNLEEKTPEGGFVTIGELLSKYGFLQG